MEEIFSFSPQLSKGKGKIQQILQGRQLGRPSEVLNHSNFYSTKSAGSDLVGLLILIRNPAKICGWKAHQIP